MSIFALLALVPAAQTRNLLFSSVSSDPDVPYHFNRVASFLICSQIDPTCNTDEETVAEIVAAADEGLTLVYTDGPQNRIGFVDISDPTNPIGTGVVALSGEPTSVAVLGGYAVVGVNTSPNFVNPSGELAVVDVATRTVVTTIALYGQPDAVAISPDKKHIAIAIENERDEDLGNGEIPQMPAGFLVHVDAKASDPSSWTATTVVLTNLAGVFEPTDPEPEFVAISADNVAVITLQENNAIVLVDLITLTVTASYTAGTVHLTEIDITEDSYISMTSSQEDRRREPDGVAWIDSTYFVTADEGDMRGGSRGFTVFHKDGNPVYTENLDQRTARIGHYPDERSGNKGNEPENCFVGTFRGKKLLFVNSERSSLVFVYDVADPTHPVYQQVLPAGVGPEGGVAIGARNLAAVASEKDSREDKIRSVINIYEYAVGPASYPTIISGDRADGTPIPFSALSGLVCGGPDGTTLYAVEDSFFIKNRIFRMDVSGVPAIITDEIPIIDTDHLLLLQSDAVEPCTNASAPNGCAPKRNTDGTINTDMEGIAMLTDGSFLIAVEGSGTVGDESRPLKSHNVLMLVTPTGTLAEVIYLPDDVNAIQLRFGFEGVAYDESTNKAVVAFQRAWGEEDNPRLGIYDIATKIWVFVYYPLEEPLSQNGGWVGLSDITPLGGMSFAVLERDNQGGPDAAIKKVFTIDLSAVEEGDTVIKSELKNLIPFLALTGGPIYEKVEGLALCGGIYYIVNDNDGVDDNSGEQQLLSF